MIFKSHIYNRQEVVEDTTNWPLLFLTILTGMLGYLLLDVNEILGSLIMALSMAGMFVNTYKDWGKKEEEGKYEGEIILTSDQFTFNKETINVSDVKDLKIMIGYLKGHKHYHHYVYTVDSGTRSSIEFYSNGIKKQYNFQLFSSKQVSDLKTVLEQLYTKRIFVKEFYLGERTYLLENLSYEEIQEFKKKYELR